MSNTNLILISVIVVIFICVAFYFIAKAKKNIVLEEAYSSFEQILDAVKAYVVELTKDNYGDVSTDEELIKLKKRKARINEALKNATFGIDSAKVMVKELIKTFLVENVPVQRVEQILGLDNESEPSQRVMFEVLMYKYKKLYGRDALSKWIENNNLDRSRPANGIVKKGDVGFYITKADLESCYYKEKYNLLDEEKIDILTVLLYQQFKGFGLVDTILEMNINGVNIGCSGSIMDSVGSSNKNSDDEAISEATNALWIYFNSNYMHFQFLDFGSEDEVRRIIQLLIRWNSPGPLSAKRGYIVNTMHDKSRIMAVRPPAAEYWATFIRKFPLSSITPEAIIMKEGVTDGAICVKLIEFIVRGLVTTAVTGRQGAGKTTLMKAIIAYFDTRYNIGVLELAPEMYLRELYPHRNIISVQETDYVTAQDLQDALKKGDRAVTIIGEVATDAVAARMIQLGMTGSLCTIFSHHANEAKDLVLTLRNSLVNAGGFDNMTTAEKNVTDVVKMNIHLDFSAAGKRCIKRITEIVQLEEGTPYPEYDPGNKEDSMAKIQKEYYVRQTDRTSFITRDILTYDSDADTYIPGECPSEFMINKIYSSLPDKGEKAEFKKFVDYYWKGIKDEGYSGVGDVTSSSNNMDENDVTNDNDDFMSAVKFLKGKNKVVEQYGFGEFDTSLIKGV